MASLRIKVARTASEMDAIAPLWNRLLQEQPHTMFQSFAWNRLAAQMFCERLAPYVVSVESDAGAAIVPAAVSCSDQTVELLGEALFDYRDVLHVGDRQVLALAWQQIAMSGRSLKVTSLEECALESRWTELPATLFTRAPQVHSALVDESAFRTAHPRLGRQMRRLKKVGIALRSYSGGNSAVVRNLYECKRRYFASDSGNLFLDRRRCEFMVQVAAQEGSSCEVFTLENEEGLLVAGLVTFRDGSVRRCYTIYFHPEWARYSPGVALLYEVTARSLADGLSCDYMTGESPYKLRLANSSRALYRLEVGAQQLAEIAAGKIHRAA